MERHRMRGVSDATDELASSLIGSALDTLAAGGDVNVLLTVGDTRGATVTYELADDGVAALLDGARAQMAHLVARGGDPVAGLSAPVRYALAYEGTVDLEDDTFADALLVEFGERGYHAYSAYCLYQGKGAGEGFTWTEPAPAGEVDPLL